MQRGKEINASLPPPLTKTYTSASVGAYEDGKYATSMLITQTCESEVDGCF